MRINLTSVMVDDQAKAETFYTGTLGFVKKHDIDMGEHRWLTVVSPEGGATQLLLEPNAHPAGKTFQAAIYADGIPAACFEVDDIQAEFERLGAAGVHFKREPMDIGPAWIAILDDTCGNYIQLVQEKR
ncbi:VOC family protein [Acanthopleuribacter pedis]|uniref:VOC family protein n=1 Tax=Acanthopleuribacter pedis TaxID=442870 RepID=A0A8J7U6D5_9BACT|nr:VOC family protein [Acanthopleuribacter pedis]MBO1320241.1 VOC family protein [Acanthopleuribacter pedis]